MAVILASQSPRRRELLTKLGLCFSVVTADVDETMQQGKDPRDEVARVCRAKAQAVRDRGHDKDLIIAADTIVVVQGEVLGKPKDREDAARMLRLLSGKDHEVMTGLTVLQAEQSRTLVETAKIHFRQLDEQELAAYIATGEPMDKAGAYGIQGHFAKYIREIRGEYTTIVGLPLGRLWHELTKFMR